MSSTDKSTKSRFERVALWSITVFMGVLVALIWFDTSAPVARAVYFPIAALVFILAFLSAMIYQKRK